MALIADRDILAAELQEHGQRLAALSEAVARLEGTLRGLAMADRQALLGMVDSRERELGQPVTTSEMRRWYKAHTSGQDADGSKGT